MNTLNKIIKNIFARDLEDLRKANEGIRDVLVKRAKGEVSAPNVRAVRVPPLSMDEVPSYCKTVKSLLYGSHKYRVVTDNYGGVYLQHCLVGPFGQWQTIRSFYDDDKEYTLNCALEAFEYLTKEI